VANLLSTIALLAVLGGLAWLGWGVEPHWASKDGTRFMCRMQVDGTRETPTSRWTDVKVNVLDGELQVYSRSRRATSPTGTWRVIGATYDTTGKRRIYVLRSPGDVTASLRVPATSRCVAELDRLVP
jgi:hypothetical protein